MEFNRQRVAREWLQFWKWFAIGCLIWLPIAGLIGYEQHKSLSYSLEAMADSFIMVFAPYVICLFIRSIRWAIKNK